MEMLTAKPPWADLEPMAALFKIATQATEPELPQESTLDAVEFIRAILIRFVTLLYIQCTYTAF